MYTPSELELDADILELERLDLADLVLLGAPQQRPHASQQLAQRERLDQVVVGTRVKSRDPIVDLAARCEHQHRSAVATLAQAPAHLQAIQAGHGDVEDHRPERGGAEVFERLQAIGCLGDLVLFHRERPRQRALYGGLVVHYEYACRLSHRFPARSVAVGARVA
jgi:hypothetical protein